MCKIFIIISHVHRKRKFTFKILLNDFMKVFYLNVFTLVR